MLGGQGGSAYDAAIERARRSAKTYERQRRREKARVEEIETLLVTSWSLRYENPSEMLRHAAMAVMCAKKLDVHTHGRERVLDLLGRALAEQANAYRVLDQLDLAEEKLEKAGHVLGLGSRDESLRIRLLELDAALAAARRKFRIAAAYLVVVFEYAEAQGDRHLAGRAMVQRGLYVGYEGDPEQALRLLDEGLSRMDEAQEPELVQTAIHNQLLFIAECGRFDEARRFWFRNLKILSRDNGLVNRYRLNWINGRIEAGLGRSDRAEAIFREVKQDFERLERPYAASIVGLDLAAALLEQDRPDDAAEVVMEAHRVFHALRIKREALVAVLILFHAIKRGEATVKMVEKVAAYLRLLERDPSAQFDPEPL
jgi:tetratricopeptide (TPR) repeat protein